MLKPTTIVILSVLTLLYSCSTQHNNPKPEYVLVIHGGAGTILKENMTQEKEDAYTQMMKEALYAGEEVLKNGGASIDAITSAIMVMENSPLFNAGKGSVLTEDGVVEMDASIMNGASGQAGAIAGVHIIKNPILGARVVMEKTDHVLLAGEGADNKAIEMGLETEDPSYFITEGRLKSFQRVKESKTKEKFGTVGAVALDKNGNLAAGTSTGGMTYKMKGRIGDSPIIGAGTFADSVCAVSATGHGEYFIRNVVAYDISALMKYTGMNLHDAAHEVIMSKLARLGGDGGIIAVDKQGNYSMTFNTSGMYRGVITSEGTMEVSIYGDED